MTMDAQPNPETRLQGRWLTLARVGWLAFFVVATSTLLIALPVRWAELTHPTPATLANLNTLGWPVTVYATLSISTEIIFASVFLGVGFIIFLRRPADRMALFTSLMLVAFGAGNQTITPTVGALGKNVFAVFGFAAWVTFTQFPYLFPNGRYIPKWTRLPALIWFLLCIPWNFMVGSHLDPTTWPATLFYPFLIVMWATFVFSMVYRYQRVSNPVERQQTKWVIYAFAMVIVVDLAVYVASYFYDSTLFSITISYPETPQGLAAMSIYQAVDRLTYLLLPIAFAFSILRYRLWNIDIIISRTLVYGALTAIVIAFYILIVGGFSELFQSSGNLFISLLATGLIAVLVQPLRERLQRAVNRLVYGERDNPISVLTKLGERLEATVAPDSILPTIVESIAHGLRLPYVAVMLKEGTEFVLAADYGTQPASNLTCERISLNYRSQSVGEILVSRRAGEDSFTADEKTLLQNIARQVGVAAYAIQVTRDLQRSRERLVTAREEERRRLRRDLHDGLGPTLASLTLKLDAARNQLKQNPDKADSLLVELKSQTQSAIEDIRRLVYNLRPPALDELGLFSAIQEYSANHLRAGLSVRIERNGDFPKLPAAVEVAAYRIVCEALTNISKHSQAAECDVRLTFNGALQIDVQDNGAGLPENAHAGVGMFSMRERAAELGGMFTIHSSANGVHVSAHLPCEVSSDEP